MTEPSPPKYHRVLLQIDAATHCQETVGAAIDITARLGGELHGIFIEDADLITVGEFDFIREFRLSSPTAHQLDRLTLKGQLRAMARSVQRQLERAGSRRKVTVGFRSVREDVWRNEGETLVDADLIIIESTNRLKSRGYRGQRSNRRALATMRPTLLLKGGGRLVPYVTVICDSVDAADHGMRVARALLGASLKNITLLPYRVTERVYGEILNFEQEFSKSADQATEGSGRVHVAPLAAESDNSIMSMLAPENGVVVLKTGGALMNNPTELESLIISQHPLLFVQ